jgi:hypothetical protein
MAPVPLPRVDVSCPSSDVDATPAVGITQNFQAATIRLLEPFAQDTSQAARKRESWSWIAQLDETEPQRTAPLADAIIFVVGAEHADKLGEFTPRFNSNFFLSPVTAFNSDAL